MAWTSVGVIARPVISTCKIIEAIPHRLMWSLLLEWEEYSLQGN
ncbi:hypothetical protein [Bartonella sp. AP19HLJMH]